MIFRGDFLAELEANPETHPYTYLLENQSKVSSVAGEKWRGLSREVKAIYKERAIEEKARHQLIYPGYSYKIHRKNKAVVQKEKKRRV